MIMTFTDKLLKKSLDKLMKESSNGKIGKKMALDVFARRVRIDKDLGRFALDELEKRGKIKKNKMNIKIL